MKRPFFAAICWFSLVLFSVGVILAAVAMLSHPDPFANNVKVGPNFNASLSDNFGGELIFFNDREVGPYDDRSIWAVGDAGQGKIPGVRAWGVRGLSFVCVDFGSRPNRSWTARVCLWYLSTPFAILPLADLVRRLSGRATKQKAADGIGSLC